jgi:hypothetical protein
LSLRRPSKLSASVAVKYQTATHELVLGRRLHGKIGGLLAFEDAIDVSRGAPVLVDEINAIGDQNAAGHINPVGNDRRKFVLGHDRTAAPAQRMAKWPPHRREA